MKQSNLQISSVS